MKLIPGFSRFAVACVSAWALMAGAQDATAPKTHGIVLANMDHSVKPGDDFYHYANGEWIKRTEIPADRAEVGRFFRLADLSNKRTADLIAEIAKSNPPASSNTRKVADLYNSYMDEAGIEAKGLEPLRPHLEAIAAIHDKRELARALGETLRADVDALNNTNFHTPNLFGMWVAPGFNDSEHYTAYLMQGGLQLPDREYYLSDSEQMKKIREQVSSPHLNNAQAGGILRLGRPRRSAFSNWSTRLRRSTAAWRRTRTSTKPTIPGHRRTFRSKRPDWIGPSTFAALGSRNKAALSSGSPKPSLASLLWWLPRLSRPGKTGWHSTSSRPTQECSQRPWRTSASRFSARCFPERSNSVRDGSAAFSS